MKSVLAASTFSEVVQGVVINSILTPILYLLGALALVYFLWGVIKYIRASGDEDKQQAQKMVIYGIIGLFVMVAVWGLVQVLVSTFNLPEGSGLKVPTFSTD